MNQKIVRISALCVLMSACAFAQQNEETSSSKNQLEEVVISDSKFALAKEKSGKVISKISSQDLKNHEGQSIAVVLNTVAGVEINGSRSAAGKNLGYIIRGGKSSQVLIVIDGVPVTDASGISLEYDLRLLPADQVESIEIMKGAASTLYGSGAATAVINITLKKAARKGVAATAYFNEGTHTTATEKSSQINDFNQGLSLSGKGEKVNFYASLNSTEIAGMSQIAGPSTNLSYEDDAFSRVNVLGKLGYKITDKLTLDLFGNYDKIDFDYDASYSNTANDDSSVNSSTSKQFRYGVLPKYKYENGEFNLNSSFNKLIRDYSEYDSFSNKMQFSQYESRSVNVDGFNKYNWNDAFFIVTGVQYQFQDMNSTTPYGNIDKDVTKFNMIDPYVTGVYNSDFGLNLNLGARWNIHSEYGNQLVYNVNPSFVFDSFPLKLVSSYSTAFVTPSLYQLYSEYGNTSLTPEKNTTIEAGFETQLQDKKISLNAVAFYREQNNFIGFYFNPVTFDANYINIEGINKAKGVETELAISILPTLKWRSNYTFTQVDKALERLVPKHKLNSGLDFQATNRLFLNANYQYVDARTDAFFDGNSFTTQNVVLGSYQIVNALIRFDVVKNRMSVFGTVTNILNEEFVENIGYNTLGRNFKLGLNFNF